MAPQTAAAALALLAAAGAPFDLPALPPPGEGYAALWEWLRTANDRLSIPDAEFRWMFGGISIPLLLLFEVVGIRRDWKLYPFLLPFWLIFGSIALGLVGGLAAAAAHLVLFPVGRIWFMVRDRRRTRAAELRALVTPGRAAVPVPPPLPPRPATDVLRAALEAIRQAAEKGRAERAAGGAPGQAQAEPGWAPILRAVVAGLGAAAGPRAPDRPPAPPPPRAPEHPAEATGLQPGKPDFSAFRPDPSRFRRRPPKA